MVADPSHAAGEASYPPIDAYGSELLAVGGGHQIYFEESGNPHGFPVVFVHGGPGSQSRPVHRRFFDPAFYRIILFDQRGCGQSMPLGSLADNTTAHVIADMDRLRRHLHVDRWLLFGGPGDVAVAEQILASTRKSGSFSGEILNLAGKTTLLELCHLLQQCQLLLTNDTGTMHVAAALGTPLVAIFGSTSPELTGPLGESCTIIRQPVECNPCFLRECPIDFRCMEKVSVEQVTEAVLKLL